ncbi:hypothetical protein SKAU_G00299350 [Synaphobranchus kaupii]|uniref:Uncharacterized protein n=1 Tax=Synaphobranchus kaupii TaxID=118154 RepID=A0A9Q1EVA4_SYNKA|nr:hypothetical protein SKAU_G00299350 [Synaphobranchus kaupii]
MAEISHVERSSSLSVHKALQPTPMPRSKSYVEPVSKKLAQLLSCQDQQNANQAAKVFEEEAEKKPCTPLLPSPRLPQTPISHSSDSAPPLVGSSCSVSEKEQVPVYLEILPGKTTTEVSHMERSLFLVTHKPKQPTPVHRSKSHAEPIFRKVALSRISQDQQKANQGAKWQKPLGTGYRSPRPERPPPPNFTQNRGSHRLPLSKQTEIWRSSDGCDTQDDQSLKTSLKIFEEEAEKKPCTPLLPSPRLLQTLSSHSMASDPPLSPPIGLSCSVSEQEQVPVYLEILPEETSFTEVSHMERSSSLPMLKLEPRTPVQRSKSDIELLSQKLALSRNGQDQQKANQGAKILEEEAEKKPCTPLLPSPRLPETSSSHSSDSAPPLSPPIEPSCSVSEQEQVPVYLEILPEETSTIEVSHMERSSSLPRHKPKPPSTPLQRSKTSKKQTREQRNLWVLAIGGHALNVHHLPTSQRTVEVIVPPLPIQIPSLRPLNGRDTQVFEEAEKKPCTPLLPCPRLPETSSSQSSDSAPPLSPLIGPSCSVSEQERVRIPLKILPEETTIEVSHMERRPSLPTHKPKPPSTPLQRSKSNVELLSQKPSLSQNSQDQQKENQGSKIPSLRPLNGWDTQVFEEEAEKKPCTPLLPCPLFSPDAELQVLGINPKIQPEETTTEAPRSKAVHDFFCKRPLPPIPHHKSHTEPLYEELGSYASIKNDYSEEHKLEDIEVLMAWWHTVGQWDNMPLDYELKEEEEMRVFNIMAYRIKMGLRLFSCLLSKNGESLQNSITELNTTADNLDKKRKKAKIAAITGGATGAMGGVAVVAGLVLAPPYPGCLSGGVGDWVNSNLDRKKVEKIVLDYRDEVADIERCLQFVSMGMGWLGQQDACRLSAADGETAAVARLAEVVSGDGGSIHTACQSLEILQNFSLAMDDFFTNEETQKVKKSTETKFGNKIRSLAEQLQEGLNSLMKIREILNKAASTTGVYEEDSYCS